MPVFGPAGFESRRAGVRYFGLEDSEQRLKRRTTVLKERLGIEDFPDNLKISTRLYPFEPHPELPGGGVDQLELLLTLDGLEGNPTRLIFIDMLKNVRPSKGIGESLYDFDSRTFDPIRALIARTGSAIVFVHHTNKGESGPEDFLSQISGSRGLAGAVDGALVFDRATNQSRGRGKLLASGRDIEANEYDMLFEGGVWTYAGSGFHGDAETIPFRSATVLAQSDGPMHYKAVATELGEVESSVRSALHRGSKNGGPFVAHGKGLYSLSRTSQKRISA